MSPVRRRKPNKKKRSTQDDDISSSQTEPKGREEKHKQSYLENIDSRQRLRDKIKAMQKDRTKGSTVCEENANHEY